MSRLQVLWRCDFCRREFDNPPVKPITLYVSQAGGNESGILTPANLDACAECAKELAEQTAGARDLPL